MDKFPCARHNSALIGFRELLQGAEAYLVGGAAFRAVFSSQKVTFFNDKLLVMVNVDLLGYSGIYLCLDNHKRAWTVFYLWYKHVFII